MALACVVNWDCCGCAQSVTRYILNSRIVFQAIEHVTLLKYSPTILKFSAVLGITVFAAILHAQTIAYLPDAPQPSFPQTAPQQTPLQPTPPGKPEPQAAGSVDRASYQKRKWAQYVDPGEHVPTLNSRDKLNFWLHEETRVSAPFPAFISAGYGQLTDTPKYGSDSGAFGDRLGAAFLRQATMRFFSSSLIPKFDGEDPRYYRKANGGYLGRAGWAAKQVFVDRLDSGRRTFNFSNIFGHLAASSLTPLYYPPPSRTARVVIQTWGTSIAGSFGNNLFLEFWPDVVNKLHKIRRTPRNGSSGTGP